MRKLSAGSVLMSLIFAVSLFKTESFSLLVRNTFAKYKCEVRRSVNVVSSSRDSLCARASSTGSAVEGESEVEKLLRKAKELRADAESKEKKLRTDLLEKKESHNKIMDDAIESLYVGIDVYDIDAGTDIHTEKLVHHLKEQHCSMQKLKKVMRRLHEREVKARGIDHVSHSKHSETKAADFEVASSPGDERELHRLTTYESLLINATAVLDEEFWAQKREAESMNKKVQLEYATSTHYNTGDISKTLQDLHRNLDREHDEQFKNRVKEIDDKSRRKDDQHYENLDLRM